MHANIPENSRPAASELHLAHHWDADAVRDLVARKTSVGRTPAFLFLGRREAGLLRDQLGANFGPESVRSLKNVYYLGLEVIELETPSFLRTAGMKRIQSFRAGKGRNPVWKDLENNSFWTFAI